jgi:hypothetical protein
MSENNKPLYDWRDFIDKMEIVYAVFLAWGFAQIAQNFRYDITFIAASFISGLVLVRFFFAASHNIGPIAVKVENKAYQQRILFGLDIPMLIIHSFIYYRMCYAIAPLPKDSPNYLTFYINFNYLLFINVIWLTSIYFRAKYIFHDESNLHLTWIVNNLVFSLALMLSLFIFKIQSFWFLFSIAFLNCLIDFCLTAPYYLGYKKIDLIFRKKIICFVSLLIPFSIILCIISLLLHRRSI